MQSISKVLTIEYHTFQNNPFQHTIKNDATIQKNKIT